MKTFRQFLEEMKLDMPDCCPKCKGTFDVRGRLAICEKGHEFAIPKVINKR